MTFKECMKHIMPYNGKDDARINKIWGIHDIEEHFQAELEANPEWLELAKKCRPQYIIMESNVHKEFKLISLTIFKNGKEEIPVIALILVH